MQGISSKTYVTQLYGRFTFPKVFKGFFCVFELFEWLSLLPCTAYRSLAWYLNDFRITLYFKMMASAESFVALVVSSSLGFSTSSLYLTEFSNSHFIFPGFFFFETLFDTIKLVKRIFFKFWFVASKHSKS